MTKTWIIYRVEMDASGWEDRKLHPSGSLTTILSEEYDYSASPRLPQVGDRVQEFENLSDPGNGVSHGREGDWVVNKVVHLTGDSPDLSVVVCDCSYQPIAAQWEELRRGAPVAEMLQAAVV